MPKYKFVDVQEELCRSVQQYNVDEKYFRELIGNAPKYFVCIKNKHQVFFGLSKFCAFKDITVPDYLREFRYAIDGGTTQKHISKITKSNWLPFADINRDIQTQFEEWIHSFFSNYNVNSASFIILSDSKVTKLPNRKISPDELENILAQKKLIGQVGERIALAYETERLRALGSKSPSSHIVHTALCETNAGYDIFSDYQKQVRMIEVKATVGKTGFLYITKNELVNFQNNPGKAYIYVVHIKDLKKELGEVTKEISDINELGDLEPILYKVIT